MKEPLVVCSDFNSSRRTTKFLKARAEPPLTDAVEMDRPVAPDSPPPAPAFIVDDDSASIPWHYIDASGETRGPVSFQVIRAQLRCAMLPPDAMVWREGLDEWCEVDMGVKSMGEGLSWSFPFIKLYKRGTDKGGGESVDLMQA